MKRQENKKTNKICAIKGKKKHDRHQMYSSGFLYSATNVSPEFPESNMIHAKASYREKLL